MNASHVRINGQHIGLLVRCGLNWEQMAAITGRSVEGMTTLVDERFYAPTSVDETKRRAREILKRLGSSPDAEWLRGALSLVGRLPTDTKEDAA